MTGRDAVESSSAGIGRRHAIPLLILAAAFFVTTVPYLTEYPFHWDGGQFVLGVHHFSVRMHQPHPPGYPLFIACGKLLSYFFSAHRSLQLLSAGFAAGAVFCLYWLAWQLWRTRWLALFLSLALLLNPLLWFYRETCLTYTADALAGVLTAWLGWLGLRRRPAFFYGNALLLGLLGGFRPSLVWLLAPLLLFPLAWSRDWKRIPAVLLLLAGACSLWYVPLVLSAGGLEAYREFSAGQFSSAVGSTSYLFGAPFQSNWNEFKRLIHTVLAALNVMAIPALLSLVFLLRKLTGRKGTSLAFLIVAAWSLPALLFFAFVHYGQIGYVLVFLPSAYLLMGPLLFELQGRAAGVRAAGAISLTMLLALQASVFAFLTPSPLNPRAVPASRVEAMMGSLGASFPMLFSINAEVQRDYDRRMGRFIELARSEEPEETIVLAGENAAAAPYRREWRVPLAELFRSLGAALPEYQVFYVPAAGADPKRVLMTQGWRSRYRDGTQSVPGSVRRVVFAIDDVPSRCGIEGLRLETRSIRGADSLVGEIEGSSFEYCGVVFQVE